MIYVFVPYWNEDTPEFKKSLESQTVPYRLIKRNRKASKILWTEAVNDFWRECSRWQGAKDDDVICIMNNDIEFGKLLFELGATAKDWDIIVPDEFLIEVDWRNKKFTYGGDYNSFIGHCFFMSLKDFRESGGFCRLLPHALADIDFSYRMYKKKKATIWRVGGVHHEDHDYEKCSKWSWRSYDNPILWTIFLLRHPNRYTLLNIIKSWVSALRNG